jgi:hypothetical protein
VTRIFLPLCGLSWILLAVAFVLGLSIGDARVAELAVQRRVSLHFLVSLGAIVFATLVHALVLTYFMGTGRWLEETTAAYRLDPKFYAGCKSLKYRTVPALVGAFVLLVITGALGAAADPGSPVQFGGWFGLSAATIHLIAAGVAVFANAGVNYLEFASLFHNGELIAQAMQEVRRIRIEKGLAVE